MMMNMDRETKAYEIMYRIQDNPQPYFEGRTWDELCADFKYIEPNPEYLWKILTDLQRHGYIHCHNTGYKRVLNHIWLLGGV